MSNQVCALFINIIHICLILYLIITPFYTNDLLFLKLYIIIFACIIFHWWISNDTCALTLIESHLTGCNPTESFFGRLVSPVYTVQNGDIRFLSYCYSFLPWLKRYICIIKGYMGKSDYFP